MTHQSVGMFVSLNTQKTSFISGPEGSTLPPKTPAHSGSVCLWEAVRCGGDSTKLTGCFFGTVNLLIWAPVYISVPAAAAHVSSDMSTGGLRFKVNAATLLPLFKILPLVIYFCCL